MKFFRMSRNVRLKRCVNESRTVAAIRQRSRLYGKLNSQRSSKPNSRSSWRQEITRQLAEIWQLRFNLRSRRKRSIGALRRQPLCNDCARNNVTLARSSSSVTSWISRSWIRSWDAESLLTGRRASRHPKTKKTCLCWASLPKTLWTRLMEPRRRLPTRCCLSTSRRPRKSLTPPRSDKHLLSNIKAVLRLEQGWWWYEARTYSLQACLPIFP